MPATVSMNGLLNTSALVVPGAYVNLIAPQTSYINGVPTNILGFVGTATWGPVNSPTNVAGYPDGSALFGAIQARAHDLMTWVDIAAKQRANNFRLVRVTDGTDVAASIQVATNCITFTSIYTGSAGNNATVKLSTGTAANSWKATVTMPGWTPEVFDNLTGTGNAFWVALANAINKGQNAARGPSKLITATAGAGTTAPTSTTYSLTGGVDGVTTINSAALTGTDGATGRTGMYALRGSGCSSFALVDCADSTTWSTQNAFGLSEGMLPHDSTPAGDTVTGFATAMTSAAIDSAWFKAILGDWCYYFDSVNSVTRLVSPVPYAAGLRAALPPWQSCLNKPLQALVGTQRSLAHQPYSGAELQALVAARGDVIAAPSPGGAYFGLQTGHNASSSAVIHMDAYTTMSDFIALTIASAVGQFVGQIQTPTQQRQAQSTISAFLQNLKTPPGGGDGYIAAFSVTLNASNNPQSSQALGYEFCQIQVQYGPIIEFFVATIQGGQSVQVTSQSVQLAA